MTFKRIIRLISMGLVLVLVTSLIVMVLPEHYVSNSGSRNSSNPISVKNISLKSFSWNDLNLKFPKISFGDPKFITMVKDLAGSIIQPLETSPEEVHNVDLNIEPANIERYYKAADGLAGEALKNALNNIINDHKELTYKEVWNALKEIDEDPANTENVLLIYTGKSIPKTSNGTGKDDWNREHVWAKSHGDFGTSKGAGTDLHHVRPADVTVNSSRNNKNFDTSDKPHHEALLCRHDPDSFEPRDAVKGDVARMLFYMAVRYEGAKGEPDLELVDYMNETKSPYHGKLSTLLEWHSADPVSDFERRRNNIIYDTYQGNRNPFIDHPEWVDEIWGNVS